MNTRKTHPALFRKFLSSKISIVVFSPIRQIFYAGIIAFADRKTRRTKGVTIMENWDFQKSSLLNHHQFLWWHLMADSKWISDFGKILRNSINFITWRIFSLSISDFHPDTWNPAWSVGTILTGLCSFMVEESKTFGSIECDQLVRKRFARQSGVENLKNDKFKELFPGSLKS